MFKLESYIIIPLLDGSLISTSPPSIPASTMAKRKTYDDSAAEQDSEEVSSLEESSSEDVLWALPKIKSSLAHPHLRVGLRRDPTRIRIL